ncbi:MAG: aquaporin [Chloroflexota bacterium]
MANRPTIPELQPTLSSADGPSQDEAQKRSARYGQNEIDEKRANAHRRLPGPSPDFDGVADEWRRVFAETLGTFFLVLVAVCGAMIDARFGSNVVPLSAQVTAPGLMVAVVILSMGAVSGAHLNPGVSIAFAIRGDFPWRKVPMYVGAQFVGAVLATLFLLALLGRQGTAGLTLPGPGIDEGTAMAWELILSVGLVTTILGTASGAQNIGPMNAIGVGSYIALAGLVGAPVSGASMNVARSLGPALVLGDATAWWVYLVGPLAGAIIAAGIAYLLRGPGGGFAGTKAAQGTLGWLWRPGPIDAIDESVGPERAPTAEDDDRS